MCRSAGTRVSVGALLAVALLARSAGPAAAQFLDEFDHAGAEGWSFFSGDGEAEIDLRSSAGYATIEVDASRDHHNIWWAFIKRDVTASLDLDRLAESGHELRIEARIKVSHAPRRVNLHVNTQRTTDFHTHLMEFEIPDTTGWHTISMTTDAFDAGPGDTVNAQLALIDWGSSIYQVDVDYFRVDVVDPLSASPDRGIRVPYHPPVPDLASFQYRAVVDRNGVIDLDYPHKDLSDMYTVVDSLRVPVLAVSGSRYAILEWDLEDIRGQVVDGPGVLEVTTHSVQRARADLPEFGLLRVMETRKGASPWQGGSVTANNLLEGAPVEEVINPQMVIDAEVSNTPGARNQIVISTPAMQRLLSGETSGLALRIIGPDSITLFGRAHADGALAARLYFNLSATD